ncbi:MAG: hypothetical protein Q4G65_13955 [bacterium]|nr:hypothetical protein [bacterium]
METKTVVGMVLTVPLMALGGTFTWTGAENGAWTNANNWAEGIVPGQYSTAGGRVGQMGDVAVFGDALTGAKATTIDFDGVYSVAQIVTSGTNRYTYGTSDTQYVPIERNGLFSAAETSATPAAVLAARLQLGVECMATNWGGRPDHGAQQFARTSCARQVGLFDEGPRHTGWRRRAWHEVRGVGRFGLQRCLCPWFVLLVSYGTVCVDGQGDGQRADGASALRRPQHDGRNAA